MGVVIPTIPFHYSIPPFHSTIPFHRSIPPNKDSLWNLNSHFYRTLATRMGAYYDDLEYHGMDCQKPIPAKSLSQFWLCPRYDLLHVTPN